MSKITVIGRPVGKVVTNDAYTMLAMEDPASKIPALPKGVPAPKQVTTKYFVYIGAKQWRKVADTVGDPDDVLILEGFPQIGTQAESIVVFATNVTSKKQQAALREQQRAAASGGQDGSQQHDGQP